MWRCWRDFWVLIKYCRREKWKDSDIWVSCDVCKAFQIKVQVSSITMGTVLSFSPRERRPIYTTHHHGSGTISTSNSTSDFQLNNYAYEQINNAKNRENSKPMQYLTVPNQFQNGNNVLFGSSNSNIMNNEERQADSARILLEKNTIEKNLKKHSLFINALSWKRLSSSHGKKKLETNSVKSKSGNITTSTFRPPALTDVVHPMVVVNNDKKKYQQQQIQLVSNNNNNKNIIANSHQPIQQPLQNQTIFYTPGDPKSLLALDLERAANNANNLHHLHNVDKVATKMTLPLRPIQLTQQTPTQQQPAPRKTIIQVSLIHLIEWVMVVVRDGPRRWSKLLAMKLSLIEEIKHFSPVLNLPERIFYRTRKSLIHTVNYLYKK